MEDVYYKNLMTPASLRNCIFDVMLEKYDSRTKAGLYTLGLMQTGKTRKIAETDVFWDLTMVAINEQLF